MRAPVSASQGPGPDSAFEASAFDSRSGTRAAPAWIGWRRRLLIGAAVLGCLGAFALARQVSRQAQIDAEWVATPGGALVLKGSDLPPLRAHIGQAVLGLQGRGQAEVPLDALALHRALRWQPDGHQRQAQWSEQRALAAALRAGPVQLRFEDQSLETVAAGPRGLSGLGPAFWPLLGLALLLYLFGVVRLLARPKASSALFALICASQSTALLLMAVENTPGLGLMAAGLTGSLTLRVALDLVAAAAALQTWLLGMRRTRAAMVWATLGWLSIPAWLLHAGLTDGAMAGSAAWLLGQSLCGLLGLALLWVVHRAYRDEPSPYTRVIRRLVAAGVASWVALNLVVAMPVGDAGTAIAASLLWGIFVALVLLLTPALGRSRQLLREFALLAGVSTVASALDVLFVAVFSLGNSASLAIAMFAAIALYAGARQWLWGHLLNGSMLTTERTFDQLYRAAREVQTWPARYPHVLAALLRELFDPLELQPAQAGPQGARVVGGGATLLVPLRSVDDDSSAGGALALRFADRGRRLFSPDDARLADRVVDQLRRAVAYDLAVERGRTEERQRIAQDLHDDIGARLLTLMYQAPTRDMEDYLRHTLQDLKTLTRGLAAAEHRLSHAAAEWKADLTQRLSVAHASLGWSFEVDEDQQLSVVQWSALTRVLRELVSNALFHGHATRVDVLLRLHDRVLTLEVADDGEGHDPQAWAHGLGLGGVRKRVKLMGGQVEWRPREDRGIVCAVSVPDFLRPG